MNIPRYSQNVMESAVEIAYTAGHYGFKTLNSRDMMYDFIAWAVKFEETPYKADEWMELIDSYATEMLRVEVEHGRATVEGENACHLQEIKGMMSMAEWKMLDAQAWVYLAANGDRILTKGDFVKLCEDEIEHAYTLRKMCRWQHPSTVIDEAGGLDKLFEEVTT